MISLRFFLTRAKKGLAREKKKILYTLLVCFLIISFVGLFKYTESPSFCGLCHNMREYVESWKRSSHNTVSCLQCHRQPGLINHLRGKWVDFQLGVTYLTVGKGIRKLHYEVDDGNCLQKGCHQEEHLKGEVVFKNVTFPHGTHLGELRRDMKLRCTSCHAQLVQGAHLTVHETNCFTCHFFRPGAIREEECASCAVGSCTSCHIEPKGDIKVGGWRFNHRKYIARGVSCEACHVNVIQGDAHVPEGKCLQCHEESERLNIQVASQLMHKNHVTDHKIECAGCHTPIRHEIGGFRPFSDAATACAKCHSEQMHVGPMEMYQGTGGIGISDSPSLMFLTHIDCIACHRKGRESQAALHTTQYAEKAMGEACVDCHGEGYEHVLDQWKVLLSTQENETNQRIFNVQQILYGIEKTKANSAEFKKARNLLNEARHNYNLVLLGRGVHNIEYAFKLLNVAKKRTDQALAALDKNYRPREFKTQMTCTTLCHIGMEKRVVPFQQTKFSHETHTIRNNLKCFDCHSPRDKHGATFLKNCAGCHHGEKSQRVTCENCHLAVKKLMEGKGGIAAEERPSNKLGLVECVDCHRGVLAKRKDGFDTLKKRCVECHNVSYGNLLVQWKNTLQDSLRKIAPRIEEVREQLDRMDRLGRHTFVYRKPFGEAELNYELVKKGNGVHNFEYAQELLEFSRHRLNEAMRHLSKKK